MFLEVFRDMNQLARWKVIQRARENFTDDTDTCNRENRENGRYIEGATRERERERELVLIRSRGFGAYSTIHTVLDQYTV